MIPSYICHPPLIKTTNYQELGKTIEFASNEVTERKYLELVYLLLLLYVIFMRKAISLFSGRTHLNFMLTEYGILKNNS